MIAIYAVLNREDNHTNESKRILTEVKKTPVINEKSHQHKIQKYLILVLKNFNFLETKYI